MTKVKRTSSKPPPIVQNIIITQINRSAQDINSWRNAIRSAENVYAPRRILLYDLYEEILLDGHLTAVCEKRKVAISNTPLVFTIDGKDQPEITKLTCSEEFINLMHYIIESKFWGHSLIEFDFENGIKPTLIPRKHVEPKNGVILKQQYEQQDLVFAKCLIPTIALKLEGKTILDCL